MKGARGVERRFLREFVFFFNTRKNHLRGLERHLQFRLGVLFFLRFRRPIWGGWGLHLGFLHLLLLGETAMRVSMINGIYPNGEKVDQGRMRPSYS